MSYHKILEGLGRQRIGWVGEERKREREDVITNSYKHTTPTEFSLA